MTQTSAPLVIECSDEFMIALDPPGSTMMDDLSDLTGCKWFTRGNQLMIQGEHGPNFLAADMAQQMMALYQKHGRVPSLGEIEGFWGGYTGAGRQEDNAKNAPRNGNHPMRNQKVLWKHQDFTVAARTEGQQQYIDALNDNTITFSIGPAGTGKTLIAVAHAVRELKKFKTVDRLILTRPVVEAGESLGFLPGSLQDKIDPYLRPILDSLQLCLGAEETAELLGNKTIELSPLAYMRGRTFTKAYVILDEAQNTTAEQMKMLLTRLGQGSRICVTGDPGQSDLPGSRHNGLQDAVARIRHKDIKGIGWADLTRTDIVRHRLVQDLVDAYADD